MRKFLLAIVFGVLFVLSLAATALAEGRREIHVSVRPRGMSESVIRWAYYPGTGLTVFGDAKDFEKATNNLIIFVFDEKANGENTLNNCTLKQILETRGEQVRPDPHQPEGGLARCGGSGQGSKKEKGWDSATAEALARVGAGASLSSPGGEAGGSPRGVAGGMNPNADPSAGVQAAVAGVQIALSVVEIRQIVRNVTRFIAARATKQAEVTAIEKAAEEAIEQLRREGKAVSREAIEQRAREAAEEAERALRAGGQAGKAPGSAPTVVHVPGPKKPPPIGQSGTPMRSDVSGAAGPPSNARGPRAGMGFTPKGKRVLDARNAAKYNGVNQCENCGIEVAPGQQNQRGVRPPENQRERDHIIPESKGGEGDPSNGQILCRTCNNKKSDRL